MSRLTVLHLLLPVFAKHGVEKRVGSMYQSRNLFSLSLSRESKYLKWTASLTRSLTPSSHSRVRKSATDWITRPPCLRDLRALHRFVLSLGFSSQKVHRIMQWEAKTTKHVLRNHKMALGLFSDRWHHHHHIRFGYHDSPVTWRDHKMCSSGTHNFRVKS